MTKIRIAQGAGRVQAESRTRLANNGACGFGRKFAGTEHSCASPECVEKGASEHIARAIGIHRGYLLRCHLMRVRSIIQNGTIGAACDHEAFTDRFQPLSSRVQIIGLCPL